MHIERLDVKDDEAEALLCRLLKDRYCLSFEDFSAMLRVRECITELPHLAQMGGPEPSWRIALEHMLELWNSERNIEQAWAWSRFCWSFGKMTTKDTIVTFEDLLSRIERREQLKNWFEELSGQANSVSYFAFFRKRRIVKSLRECLNQIAENLSEIDALLTRIRNQDLSWPSRGDFRVFAAKRGMP